MSAGCHRHAARSLRAVAAPLPLLALALLPAALALLAAACAGPEAMVHREPGDPIGRGTLIVVNAGANTVSLMDALTGDRIIDLPAGEGPSEVAVSPGGATAVVANRGAATDGHTLSVIDVRSATVRGTIELGQHGRPGGLRFLPGGRRLLATSGATGALLVVDASNRRLVRAVPTGFTHSEQLALQVDDARVWISHGVAGTVSAIDVDQLAVITTLETGAGAAGLQASLDGKEIWVCNQAADTLAVIDIRKLAVVARLPCPGGPARLCFLPDGERAFVACAQSGDVALFSVGQRQQLARIPLALSSLERADSRLFGYSLPADAVVDTAPADVLPSRNGWRVWVSHPGANIVSVLDLSRLEVAGRLRAGAEPRGLGWTPLLPGQF